MLNCIDLWLRLYALQCSIIFVNICMQVCVVKRLLAQVSLVQWTQFCLSCSYNFTVVSRSLIMWWCTFTSKVSTRLGMQHSVFGQPSRISEAQLPTKETVFRCYLWYRDIHQHESKTPGTRDIAKLVATDVLTTWNKASIPTIVCCAWNKLRGYTSSSLMWQYKRQHWRTQQSYSSAGDRP